MALAAFAPIAPALSYPPVWDDIGIVRHVEKLYREGGLAGVVLSEWQIDAASPETGGFHRPVVLLSLWAENRLALSVPWNHHVTNVALHVLNSLAVLALLTPLFARVPALFGALLFAVHPVHVESVALATNRTDLLACFFSLVATLAWRRASIGGVARESPRDWRWFGLSLAAFLLAVLSKEVALVLPLALLAWGLIEGRGAGGPALRRLRQWLPWLAGWGLLVLAMLALRDALGIGLGPGDAPSNRSTAAAGVSGILGLWGTYARLLMWPWPLKSWYGTKAIAADGATLVWLGALIGLGLSQATRTRGGKGLVGLAWIASFLLPVSGVVPLSTATAAERFLYIPSVGYAIVVAAVLCALGDRPSRWTAVGLAATVMAVVTMGIVSLKRIAVWSDGRSLAEEMIRLHPEDPIGYTNLGVVELERGNYAEAIALTREAMRRAPQSAGLQVNVGLAYEGLGQTADAIDAYRKATQLAPDSVATVRRLAALLERSGRMEEAVEAYRRAIRLDPTDGSTYNNFGVLLGRMGRFDEASGALTTATAVRPGYAEAHFNLGAVALHRGAPDRAITHLNEALRLKPDYVDALNNLGIAQAELGRLEEAARTFSRVLEVEPGNVSARGNLERLREIAAGPAAQEPAPP